MLDCAPSPACTCGDTVTPKGTHGDKPALLLLPTTARAAHPEPPAAPRVGDHGSSHGWSSPCAGDPCVCAGDPCVYAGDPECVQVTLSRHPLQVRSPACHSHSRSHPDRNPPFCVLFFPTDSPKELLWSQSQDNEMKLFFFCVCHLFQLYWFTPVPGGRGHALTASDQYFQQPAQSRINSCSPCLFKQRLANKKPSMDLALHWLLQMVINGSHTTVNQPENPRDENNHLDMQQCHTLILQ